jgi:hypothetical protein
VGGPAFSGEELTRPGDVQTVAEKDGTVSAAELLALLPDSRTGRKEILRAELPLVRARPLAQETQERPDLSTPGCSSGLQGTPMAADRRTVIAKALNSNRASDPRDQAGREAEQTMAFYLRRAFERLEAIASLRRA